MSDQLKPFRTRATRLTVLPEGDPIFSEMATHIELDDEAAGEYVTITQDRATPRYKDGIKNANNAISITPEEWPVIKAAIDQLIEDIKP